MRGHYFGTFDGGPCKERLVQPEICTVHTRTQVSYIMEPSTTRKNYKSPKSLRSSRPQQTVPNASFFLNFFLESQIMKSSGGTTKWFWN